MPGDTSYDIWTDWPMFLWRNDAELAGPRRTAEIANASGMYVVFSSHFWALWPLQTGLPFLRTLHPAPHITPCTLEGAAALVPVPIVS